jgi:hypothetical protein
MRPSNGLEQAYDREGSKRAQQVHSSICSGIDRAVRKNAMRSVLALCLLIALFTSANVAARGHHPKSRDVIVRPSQAVIPSYATPGGVRIYRDDSVPGGMRTDHDDPPAYDDPSKFGGG